jgi:hypothetical protein
MTQNSGNQRVRNAVLSTKLDHLIEGQEEIKDGMKLNTEARIASTERWKAHEKEHASLNTKKWAGDIGAAIAGALTAVGITVAKS